MSPRPVRMVAASFSSCRRRIATRVVCWQMRQSSSFLSLVSLQESLIAETS
jgi:hypothetical protein